MIIYDFAFCIYIFCFRVKQMEIPVHYTLGGNYRLNCTIWDVSYRDIPEKYCFLDYFYYPYAV